jgi:hypothetical protein
MESTVPNTRCYEGEPCGFAEGMDPENCQMALNAAYDLYSDDSRELANLARCPFAVTRWMIFHTPPEVLRTLLDNLRDEDH